MAAHEAPKKFARPYFLPPDVDFDSLPESVKVAYETIVQPAYDELVLYAPNALLRSIGASFVFLLAEELLDHFEMGNQIDFARAERAADRELRDRALVRHMKLLGAKNAALHALLRLRRMPPFPPFPPFDFVPPATV